MTALALHYVYQPFTRAVNTGSSPESKHLEERFKEIVLHFRSRAERERAFSELARAIDTGNEENWDQYGGAKVDRRVSQFACRFLNALPSAIPAPEVGLDPDGEISFSWIVSRDRQLSVSLSPEGLLSYAGVFGNASTAHGTEEFDDTVPQAIIEAIRRLGFRG
jgi:hypothetical protein